LKNKGVMLLVVPPDHTFTFFSSSILGLENVALEIKIFLKN